METTWDNVMLKHRNINTIAIVTMLIAVAFTIIFINGRSLGMKGTGSDPGYVTKLFDQSRVHHIDIEMEDWEEFLSEAEEEKYYSCSLNIDGETFPNVGLRAKGNNSLHLTKKYGLDRYSMKVEFDHFTAGSYHGLDKFSLDSSFQDNSYMKTFLTFDMMSFMGVPTPLCSYTWVTVNGKDRGLFLAVEEPEESFAKRNFGANHGQLYKPDYKSLEDDNFDVGLFYTNEKLSNYDNIFRKAKFKPSEADKKRLISSLKTLSTGKNLEDAVNIDEVMRYFPVQTFVVNLDGYLGKNAHNYFLYEEKGRLAILPWDYNLAFGTYSLGMPNPINDAELYVNHPIDTPSTLDVMEKRPLFHNLMKNKDYFDLYHTNYDMLITEYFESGLFEKRVAKAKKMISPYVKKDPTAFCSYTDHLAAIKTIEKFCLLRAQNIRGQLDGSIPSTWMGQKNDRRSLVDASEIWLPDMGEVEDLRNGYY